MAARTKQEQAWHERALVAEHRVAELEAECERLRDRAVTAEMAADSTKPSYDPTAQPWKPELCTGPTWPHGREDID